jgi:hypothetical protein
MRTNAKTHRKRSAGISISIDKRLLAVLRKRSAEYPFKGNLSALIETELARACSFSPTGETRGAA